MKLAKVIYSAEGVWMLIRPAGSIRRPPLGTIVQYEHDSRNLYSVYFPGVQGYAPIRCYLFWEYFEDLDDETS